jgi:hypothetical protein
MSRQVEERLAAVDLSTTQAIALVAEVNVLFLPGRRKWRWMIR